MKIRAEVWRELIGRRINVFAKMPFENVAEFIPQFLAHLERLVHSLQCTESGEIEEGFRLAIRL